MVANPPILSQLQIEMQLERSPASPDKNRTVREIFGEMDQWVLHLGPYQFLLNPLTRVWFLFDSIHDEWRPTGYSAGTVIFSLDGEDIIVSPGKSHETPGIMTPPSSLAGSIHQKSMINCPNCGASLPSSARFCRKCGKPINPEVP